MEDKTYNQVNTAASNFYSDSIGHFHDNFTIGEQLFSQAKMRAEEESMLKLEERVSRLEIMLSRLREDQQKAINDMAIAQCQKQKLNTIELIQNKNGDVEKQIKAKAHQQTAKLDKQFQCLFKTRKEVKSKYGKEIQESLEELERVKKQTFEELAKLQKSKINEIYANAANLKGQIQSFKRKQSAFQAEIMGNLEAVRVRLNTKIKKEEKKREEIEKIIYALLEKTCTRAKQSIRRKLY